MNRKSSLVTGGVAAAVAAATVAAGPALAAGGTKTVTQHFDAKSSSSVLTLSKTSEAFTDNDVQNGKKLGLDLLYCTETAASTSDCHVVFAQNGGLLYATFSLADKTGVLKGAVTGGTGSFTHATGTLNGQVASQTDVQITLQYKQ